MELANDRRAFGYITGDTLRRRLAPGATLRLVRTQAPLPDTPPRYALRLAVGA